MLVWAGLMVAAVIAEILWKGLSSYRLNVDNFLSNLATIFMCIFLIPIQATAEEVFFRGYLLQATGRLTRNWVVLGIINSLFFNVSSDLSAPSANRHLGRSRQSTKVRRYLHRL